MTNETVERKQISLRLDPDLLVSIDERRGPQGISRDEWISRAASYCLALPKVEIKP